MDFQSVFEDTIFILIFGGVTFLEVTAALYLLLRRANAIAPDVTPPSRLRRWAATLLAATATSHILWVTFICSPTPEYLMILSCLDILFLIIPLSGTLMAMLQDRHRPIWPVVLAIAPIVALTAMGVIFKDDSFYTLMYIYALSLYVLFTIYMLFALRSYGRWLRNNYADLEHKEIFQSLLLIVVFLLAFYIYGSDNGGKFYRYFLQADNILVVCLLLWRVETLQKLEENNSSEAKQAEDFQKAAKSHVIPANIGPLLKVHCEDALLFLQYDLTLAQLAHIIGTNRYYLSQYFAQQGLTYNSYINGLRVGHFIHLYHEAVSSQRIFTVQQLAFESGFNSYSTFSSAFKQKTGKTVTAWMRSAE